MDDLEQGKMSPYPMNFQNSEQINIVVDNRLGNSMHPNINNKKKCNISGVKK